VRLRSSEHTREQQHFVVAYDIWKLEIGTEICFTQIIQYKNGKKIRWMKKGQKKGKTQMNAGIT
jgi:hypothetical protein